MAARGWLIRGGDVVTPEGIRRGVDVRIDDAAISRIGPDLAAGDLRTFDARGLVVAPGFIDIHVNSALLGDQVSFTNHVAYC